MPPVPRIRTFLRPYPASRARTVLALEELEAREVLSPVVTAPLFFSGPPQTPEGASVALAGGPYSGGSSFAAFDLADTGQTYTADLVATHGTLAVDIGLAGEFGVGVANNGTPRVTLTGGLPGINSLLAGGYVFAPDPYYSGDATLSLSVPDPAGLADGYAEYPVQVLPVVQPPAVTLNLPSSGFVGPGPIVFAPGTIAVDAWADADGSETVSAVLALSGPGGFTLTAGGAPVPLDSDFQWVVTAADQPTLQALLDSLVLTPPDGFRGTFFLDVTVLADDTAAFPSTGDQQTDEVFVTQTFVPFRYFGGGAAVTASPLATAEGQPLDLGGLLAVADPDDQPGDTHTVTLAAASGVLVFDPAAGSFAATVTGSGTGTLTVTGSLTDVAAVLAAPGAVTFDPPAYFSGEVPLTVTFAHQRPDGKQTAFRAAAFVPSAGVSYPAPVVLTTAVRVAPVASFPGAVPLFEGAPVLPVGPGPTAGFGGLFRLFALADADGSEAESAVVELVGGPTPGFTLAAGGATIPRQADGSWVLLAADAAGLQALLESLTITPAGGLTGFGYSLRVTVRVADSATYPSDGTTATDVSTRPLPDVPLRLFAGGFGVSVATAATIEGQPTDLGNHAVRLTDPDARPGDTYYVTLQLGDPAAAFALFDPSAVPSGVSVDGFGTTTLTADGDLDSLTAFFAATGVFGFTAPTAYYSGVVSVAASVTAYRVLEPFNDPYTQSGTSGAGTGVVQPVASSAAIFSRGYTEVFAPSAAWTPGAGFFYVASWPDADGSETGRVLVSLGGVADASGFALAVNGTPVAPVGPGQWLLTGASADQLQAQLDGLTLTPPTGFAGRVTLTAALTLTDTAAGVPSPFRSVDSTSATAAAPLRFFAAGAAVGPPLVTGSEGQPLPLGGVLTAADPNDLPGDLHTLTLAVPAGALVADPAAVPATVSLGVIDARTVTLDGPLADIAAFLATPGSLTFDPQDAAFSGVVPLRYTLAITPFVSVSSDGPGPDYTPPPATGTVTLALARVVTALTPVAADVATDAGVPVALAVSVPGLADLRSTETATIRLLGLSAGSALNRGTTAGDGTWTLSAADLDGLTFTPPPGFAGVVTLTVLVTVTDTEPETGTETTAVGSASFAVTVRPAVIPPTETPVTPIPTVEPAPTPAPEPTPTPTPVPTTITLLPPLLTLGGPLPGGESRTDTGGRPAGPSGPGSDPGPAADRSRPDALASAGLVYGTSGPDNNGPPGARLDAAGPVVGPLFARAEPPAPPLVLAADRHPLPPVLPLDQSAPAAGFTDSGGDNLALIDSLLREAIPVTVPVAHAAAPPGRSAETGPAAHATTPGPAGPTAWAADGGEPGGGGGWPFDWLAAGLGLAAAGWFARGRGLGRWCRRRLPGFLARLFPTTKEPA